MGHRDHPADDVVLYLSDLSSHHVIRLKAWPGREMRAQRKWRDEAAADDTQQPQMRDSQMLPQGMPGVGRERHLEAVRQPLED